MIGKGVREEIAADKSVSYVPNSTIVTATQLYGYSNPRNYHESAIFDASYVKLREVSLTYRLPKSFVNRLKVQNASIAVLGNNLFMWTKAGIKGLDPEKAFQQKGSSWSQGIEYYNILPYTGSLGFKLNVDF